MKNSPFAFLPAIVLTTAGLFSPSLLFSQKPQTLKPSNSQTSKPYFQQEVNYKIVATLDDSAHTLTGSIEIEYVNHSPDALPEIWMHLWPNAFKNRQTAFCKQKLRDGSSRFYFADDKDLGYFKNLDFKANGQKIEWQFDKNNPDIALLKLAQPLAPGARVTIATPFFLKTPASFSRLGHVETSYQMTQWYPKPAVYDREGWHPMPYLDQGEFYSEFGSFDVTLTLPENYVVGATGVLQTPSEIEFLAKKEAESREKLAKGVDKSKDPFPPSSATLKTIRYTAGRVHDFAWFADKRFFVLKDTAHLASGKTVDCWAMFSNSESDIWEKGAFYVRRAVEFYSEKVGEYPYPHATAVHSALSAGGGMEYPMITVIGDSENAKSLDEVITHEVGHNWFYGILASNERDHPFMDEGLNTYYEMRYMKQYYGDSIVDSLLPKFIYDPKRNGPLLHTGYLLLARERKDTPPDTHSNDFAPMAYGLQVYMKTALCLNWLEKSVGTSKFDSTMQEYYRQWQFRHPYPDDLWSIFQKEEGKPNWRWLWFFDAMKTQEQADYALTKVVWGKSDSKWHLQIERKGELKSPFPITALKDGKPIKTEWFDGFPTGLLSHEGPQNTMWLTFDIPDADAFVIDNDYETLDLNRRNNSRKAPGALSGLKSMEFTLGFEPFENPQLRTLAVLPWAGWNNYDKTMLGIVAYKPPLPSRAFQYYALLGYGLGSKEEVMLLDARYSFLSNGIFPKITVGAGLKSFSYDRNWADDYYLKFFRIAPQVRAELRDNSLSFRHFLNLRTLFIGKEDDLRDATGTYVGKETKDYTIFEARYEAAQKKLPNPWNFVSALEWQNGEDEFGNKGKYLRGTLEWRQRFFYKPGKKVTMRAFAGGFLQNYWRNKGILAGDVAQGSLALNPQGFNDYRFDQVYLARTGDADILGRQMSQTEGGFKAAFGAPYAGTIGVSNNYIFSLNLKADLPQKLPLDLPIKPWFDIGYFDDATLLGEGRPASEQWLWSGGFMLEFFGGGLEIYFPAIHSKWLKAKYDEVFGGDYWKWISWSARLDLAQPAAILDNLVR